MRQTVEKHKLSHELQLLSNEALALKKRKEAAYAALQLSDLGAGKRNETHTTQKVAPHSRSRVGPMHPRGLVAKRALLMQKLDHPISPPDRNEERRKASQRVLKLFVEEFLTAYVKVSKTVTPTLTQNLNLNLNPKLNLLFVEACPDASEQEARAAAVEHWKQMPFGEKANTTLHTPAT